MKKFLAFVWLALSAFPVWAQDEPKYPDWEGSVNDFAHILSDQAKADLHSVVDTFRDTKGPCVVIVTTPSLYGLSIEDYTNQLFKRWKVGHKNNDGVLFLVAPNERKVRIEVGYGLEPTMPDLVAKRILVETVRPFFTANRWDDGILAGTKAIIAKLGGPAAELPEPVTPAPALTHNSGGFKLSDVPWWVWVVGVLFILFIISLVRSGGDGIAGFILGAVMSGGDGGGGWSSGRSGGGGGGGGGSGGGSFGGGDSGGGGSSDSF